MHFVKSILKVGKLITGLKGSDHNYGSFVDRECQSCGQQYTPYHPRQKYCCEECQRIASRKQTRQTYQKLHKGERSRYYNIWYNYKLSAENYRLMLENQNHLCAICDKRKATDVDHCHTTGIVRGILCGPCNKAIGLLGDTSHDLQKVVDYLDGKKQSLASS